jgi:hypothetical protein
MATDTDTNDLTNEETIDVLNEVNTDRPALALYGAFLVGFLGFFLDFVTVSAPIIGTISVAGTNYDVFYLGLVCVLVGAGGTALERYGVVIAASIGLVCSGLYMFVLVQSALERVQSEMAGNVFSGTVSASVGIGVWVVVLAGIAAGVLAAKRFDSDDLSIE